MSWFLYTHCEGVARDDAETLKWYRMAAEQRDADAQFNRYLFATVSTPYLKGLAMEEVLQTSRIMMASAAGAREYTSVEIAPLLKPWMGSKFYPQAVSAYAAVKHFDVLHAQFPDYSYREPALNPTNPIDRATDWESDILFKIFAPIRRSPRA